MKRTALLTAALIVVATSASALTIKNSKHDLSTGSGASWKSTTTTNEICVFCHTPHNPAQNIPLWNRTNPAAGSFTLYKTSPTLTTVAQASVFASDSISLFCMSCHDGVTSLGAMTNTPPSGADTLGPLSGPANLGINLQNDHPVGFRYDQAQGADAGLVAMGTANTALGGNAFFGSGGNMIECASCHKVHDNAFAPFLRTSNANSALCLACHAK